MTTSGLHSKTETVLIPLREKILKGEYPKDSKLPSIRKIADSFSVSVGTVRRALDTLTREKLIEKRIGSGIYVKTGKALNPRLPRALSQPAQSKTEKVLAQIYRDISEGSLVVGEHLPQKKELRYRLKTSLPTLNEALALAEQKGLLHQVGSRWLVGPSSLKTGRIRQRVYTLSAGAPSVSHRASRGISSGFLVPFESELANCGISLCGNIGPNDPNRLTARDMAGSDALGFLFHGYSEGWKTRRGNNRAQVERDMKWLSGLGRPAVVFNCAPVLGDYPDFSFKPFRNVFALGMDNAGAAQAIVMNLALLGHKRIAFFSYSSDSWNNTRFTGLVEAAKSFSPQNVEVIPFQAGFQKSSLWSRIPNPERRERINENMRKLAGQISPESASSRRESWREISAPLFNIISRDHQEVLMRSFFQRALANKRITAWTTADPSVALTAAKFLRKRGIAIPKQISLATIDDDETMSLAGITACNLQVDRLGYLAAHCLLGDIPIRRHKNGLVVCPCKIIDRGSVARV